jgi:hypothetical protein
MFSAFSMFPRNDSSIFRPDTPIIPRSFKGESIGLKENDSTLIPENPSPKILNRYPIPVSKSQDLKTEPLPKPGLPPGSEIEMGDLSCFGGKHL